jgi:hypothetical protein
LFAGTLKSSNASDGGSDALAPRSNHRFRCGCRRSCGSALDDRISSSDRCIHRRPPLRAAVAWTTSPQALPDHARLSPETVGLRHGARFGAIGGAEMSFMQKNGEAFSRRVIVNGNRLFEKLVLNDLGANCSKSQ